MSKSCVIISVIMCNQSFLCFFDQNGISFVGNTGGNTHTHLHLMLHIKYGSLVFGVSGGEGRIGMERGGMAACFRKCVGGWVAMCGYVFPPVLLTKEMMGG